jgi:hypothetical protein
VAAVIGASNFFELAVAVAISQETNARSRRDGHAWAKLSGPPEEAIARTFPRSCRCCRAGRPQTMAIRKAADSLKAEPKPRSPIE